MELLDRYLQAVGFWLPKAQKQDILAELSEEIHSQIDEKEAETGHPLDDVELEAILKHCGDPLLVAEHYLPSQPFIGPVLFPIYRFVLKLVLLGYLVPWLLVWICLLIFDPAYRAAHPGLGQISNLSTLWSITVNSFFFITLGFALIERYHLKDWLMKDWSPRKLPAVRDPNRIPRANTLGDLAFGILFCILWINFLWGRTEIVISTLRLILTSNWVYFFWALLLLSFINIGFSIMNLFRPCWTKMRATFRLLTDALGTGIFCWFFKAQLLVGIETPALSAVQAQELVVQINRVFDRIFPFTVGVAAIVLAIDIYRISRVGDIPYAAHKADRE
jgi:hypothetical protein